MKLRSKAPQQIVPTSAKSISNLSTSNTMGQMMMIPSTSQNSSSSISIYGTRRRSSTASTEFSPDSPGIGRIAKSNARVLNGLDLTSAKSSGGYLDGPIVLQEFKTSELFDKCPTVNKLLKNNIHMADETIIDKLSAVQFELEELLAQNVDHQQTINGEIVYLTTGEYPTVDLKNRPMPSFEMVKNEELKKLTQRASHPEAVPSTSLVDLGLHSSPEDDDDTTPHILDIPKRFWTWSREYLKHITQDYVNNFKERIVNKFSEEFIINKYCQEVDYKLQGTSPKQLKRKYSLADPIDSQLQKTPIKQTKIQKSLHESPSLKKRVDVSTVSKQHKTLPINQMNGKAGKTLNGLHPRLSLTNGINGNSKHLSIKKSAANEDITSISRKANSRFIETPKLLKKLEVETEDEEEDASDNDDAGAFDFDLERDEQMEGKPEIDKEYKDEVTEELKKQKAELVSLYAKTKPIIDQLHGRICKEYAVHEVFRQLDEADYKLYQNGSKVERLHAFNKEQRQEARAVLNEHQAKRAMFHRASNTD